MPWQAHLFVGVPVHNYDEVRAVFTKLGIGTALAVKDEDLSGVSKRASVKHRGKVFRVAIAFMREYEGGCEFPVGIEEKYTDAIVGFELTSRYKGAILDAKEPNGRPEPFVFDPNDCAAILKQVREWWPAARLMIWDNFH